MTLPIGAETNSLTSDCTQSVLGQRCSCGSRCQTTVGSQAPISLGRESAPGRVLPVMFPIELTGTRRGESCYGSRATAQSAARCAG